MYSLTGTDGKRIVPSQDFLKTKDIQVFLQMDQWYLRFNCIQQQKNLKTLKIIVWISACQEIAFKFVNVFGPFAL